MSDNDYDPNSRTPPEIIALPPLKPQTPCGPPANAQAKPTIPSVSLACRLIP
jgi:hypothetical protein